MLSGGTEGQFSKPRRKDESVNTRVSPKGATPVFLLFPVFLVPRLDPIPVFDGLAVFRQRGTKNIGFAWTRPATVKLHCTHIQGWIPLPGPVPDAVVY